MTPKFEIKQDRSGQYEITIYTPNGKKYTAQKVSCNSLEDALMCIRMIYGSQALNVEAV
jgi:hypothetical protein